MPMTASPQPYEQAIKRGGRDAVNVIGGVVRLEPDGQTPRKADGGPKRGHNTDL